MVYLDLYKIVKVMHQLHKDRILYVILHNCHFNSTVQTTQPIKNQYHLAHANLR